MTYPTSYIAALEWTMIAEDGPKWRTQPKVTRTPNDPGGLTKYGISQRAHPDLDIANLTPAQAEDLYYKQYWHPCSCSQLPTHLAQLTFDTAVNCGNENAKKILQRAVGAKDDGKVGEATIRAASVVPAKEALFAFTRERLFYYATRKDDLVVSFGRGWINRALRQMHDIERTLG